jgi:hypothetical protein
MCRLKMSTTNPFDTAVSDRLARYRAMADSARREAARAAGDARDSYLFIADQWDRLAEMARKPGSAPSRRLG